MTEAPTRVRRPRMSSEREFELLSIAMDVLREVGYEALTMDEVATRGHCSKATLYRTWPGKLPLILAALRTTTPSRAEIDTGALRDDLITFCARLIPKAEKDAATVAAVSHAVLAQPELARTVRATLLAAGVDQLDRFVTRAVDRGELTERPAGADLLPQVLLGVSFSQPLYEGGFADMTLLVRVIDQIVLPALGYEPKRPPNRSNSTVTG
ncbi:TetR/AcrR family transcriptional regulator [Nocardia alni]|uniref:TetR/AcrR family transcriptional regulator n=1 Tax=Nocardia alni TaxID=2815723 RepID=UPI001C218769|nr:TetR/AcrR family transcriptional regulator [Nocardia alni]